MVLGGVQVLMSEVTLSNFNQDKGGVFDPQTLPPGLGVTSKRRFVWTNHPILVQVDLW